MNKSAGSAVQEIGVRKLVKSGLHSRAPLFVPSAASDASTLWELLDRYANRATGGETVVMLTGERPGGGEWDGWVAWRDGSLPAGWQVDKRGHYLADPELPVLRFWHVEHGRCEVRRWAGWVDESEHSTAADAAEAWSLAEMCLFDRWPWPSTEPVLLGSPAATGRHLWQRSIPDGVLVEPPDDDTAEQLRATTTQGRAEVWALPDSPPELSSVCVYDARLAYLAVTDGLGWGQPVYQSSPPASLFGHGRWWATVTAPDGWRWPGLVPVLTADGWRWPTTGTHTGWVDGVELWLADRHGWDVRIHDGLTWPKREWDPLRGWADRLLGAAARAGAERGYSAPVRRQAERAIRAIGLYGIGAFHGRAPRSTHRAPLAEAMPSARAVSMSVDGDDLVWTEAAGGRQAARAAALAHPEWTGTIWARARARLAYAPTGARGVHSGFLSADPSTLIGCRTDSLVMTHDPRWPDDGKPGRYRRKLLPILLDKPVARPAGLAQLDTLLRQLTLPTKANR